MTVLGISSSVRGKRIDPQIMLDVISQADSFDDILQAIYDLGGDKKISNTEALLMSALYGVKSQGLEFDLLHLKDETINRNLVDGVLEYDGLIISSPVYFGDRSSLFADFLQQTTWGDFTNKSVGVVSAGAKRNGGQETTNIYTLYDCLRYGASVVGNGPPTSQYGGTGWAGDVGGIIDDNFGLITSKGTGQNVARLTKVNKIADRPIDINILFLITRESKGPYLVDKFEKVNTSENTTVVVKDISEANIRKCVACNVCPCGSLNDSYTCVIQDDDMRDIHAAMTKADCIILVGYQTNLPNIFQTFIERTRFIRRNHFEMSYKIFSIYNICHYLGDIFTLRAFTGFLRHNMFILGPFNNDLFPEKPRSDEAQFISRLEYITRKTVMAVRDNIISTDLEYVPVGYK